MPLFIDVSDHCCSLTQLSRAGLSCAAMLARYGFGVTVCESHYAPGGAAHGKINFEATSVVSVWA